ncbi:hypothetical protein MAR_010653 [Mya arenaria]|uniref:Chitin-binding type-2 domain-containing protein n=1 Tax=Mya arenaria TaxID=6604 RepID=A0ABY7FVM4_MYAAR|nr:hypothetical protein MAR_010653 [Mya arenaria]
MNHTGQWQVATNPCVNNALQALNFPHPSDASKFLQCGLYERMYVVQCPTGELYDQATSSCISPKAIVAQPTYIASLGIPSPCTAQSLQAGRIFFSVANSNKQFIQCDAAGIARVITCPDQLIWDQNRQSCVYTLQGGVANPGYLLAVTGFLNGANPCTAQAISAQALFFSHPDPTKFIQCDLQGNAFVQRCPSGGDQPLRKQRSAGPEFSPPKRPSKVSPMRTVRTNAIIAQPTYIASLGIPSPCTAQSLQAGRIFFSVANSNKQFIQCDAAGNARVITCPDQLIWDQNRQSCIYTLQGGVANPGYLAAVTGFVNGANPCTAQAISAQALFFSHPDPTKFIQCDLQGNAFVQRCPSGQWQVATNPCVNNALQALNFPHPSDASKFLQCGLYERMYVVQCPTGELYDQATSSCISPKAIVAQPTYIASLGIPSPCTAQSLQAGRIFFSVANSNKQFIQCDAAGIARVITCPDQLIWDQNRQSCVYTLQGGVANPGYLAAVTEQDGCVFAGFVNGANPCTAQAISAQALFFSHPDPTKFIQCDLQGNAFVQRCPSGLEQVATNPCVNNALQALTFPHPSDSAKFLQCGLYGRMYTVQCPALELYDQATSSCISPKASLTSKVSHKTVILNKRNRTFVHCNISYRSYILGKTRDFTCTTYNNMFYAIVAQPTYITSLGIPSPCTAQSLQAGRIFFSVSNSNKQFIQCDAAGNARVITCPNPMFWDQNRQSCVFSLQGGILNGANPCTAQAISAQALFFSHPDPTKFIQCDLQGNAFVQRCPSGLVWNQYLETCASQLASYTLTGQTNTSG